MKKSELRQIIKETINEEKVQVSYNKIIELIKKESRRLSDDDSFELHERLKKFFNRAI